MTDRRKFIKQGLMAAGAAAAASPLEIVMASCSPAATKRISISGVSSDFEREPLIRPFGFKGGYLTELWQTVSYLESSSGIHSTGLSTQSILWSDESVFASHSEAGGNALMYAITERAMQMVNGQTFTLPSDLLDAILPEIYSYGCKVTANPRLRKTFVLNALVGLDNALWLLYARENKITTFDGLIPAACKPAFSFRHDRVAGIPLIAYNVPVEEIKATAEEGYFFMKIKIGQPGTQEEMLEKDKERLSAIHKAIGNIETAWTENGRLPYYFDANGRYEKKETLMKFLDHARSIGAGDQIVIIEEPFPEEMEIDVSDIPVRLAADESAHTAEDAIRRIEMGYGSIALKAIAKTLSMTMKIAQAAYERNIPCFCADLTVNPVLVEWNRNVAARLSPFPGIGSVGLMESNGHQNYLNWNSMLEYHPRSEAPWIKIRKGFYELDREYYRTGGGIFDPVPHYEAMFTEI